MRAFIGVDFEQEFKNQIYDFQQTLTRYAIKGRWKSINNFHLTLKFLDDINMKQKEHIDSVMNKLCDTTQNFSLKISDIGIFSGRDSICVLWLGLSANTRNLHSLHKSIDKLLAPIGFEPEKRNFKPHITIGQNIIFDRDFKDIKGIFDENNFSKIKVNEMFLFSSEQIDKKRIYTKISEYKFK